ncbi:hypothetical protein BT67DRAFT_443666 [Trichocladium antarcticum]|uniref:Uncharacterized protein n=1 Tax=Trichocladium antarcticum TaxID=1450529 RepID=A0AAN6UGQ4_9PEZI|nr:hypothetical protein BT67DRAFT_443666 [Trichocladium antarcticum]
MRRWREGGESIGIPRISASPLRAGRFISIGLSLQVALTVTFGWTISLQTLVHQRAIIPTAAWYVDISFPPARLCSSLFALPEALRQKPRDPLLRHSLRPNQDCGGQPAILNPNLPFCLRLRAVRPADLPPLGSHTVLDPSITPIRLSVR